MQVLVMVFEVFGGDVVDVDQFVVVVVYEVVVDIQYVGQVVGEIGIEVEFDFVQYQYDVVGYVFVVVVVGVFDYCQCIGIVYVEVFVGVIGCEQFVVGGVVQVGVVDDGGVVCFEVCVMWWVYYQLVVGYVFVDVIVGFVFYFQLQVVYVECVEVLFGGVVEVQCQWCIVYVLVVVCVGDCV